jgi:hypothetical protein
MDFPTICHWPVRNGGSCQTSYIKGQHGELVQGQNSRLISYLRQFDSAIRYCAIVKLVSRGPHKPELGFESPSATVVYASGSKHTVCKTVGNSLRRFESYCYHHDSQLLLNLPFSHDKGGSAFLI